MSVALRPASPKDAADMAVLVDIAGHGLPHWFWTRAVESGEAVSVLAQGRARARRDEGTFSWRNAVVAESNGEMAGVLVGCRQPDEAELLDATALHPSLVPLFELEAEAPGTWYINVVCVYPEFEGRGIGARLLERAEALADETASHGLSLIVEDSNTRAIGFYERRHYRIAASRDFLPFPLGPKADKWLLLTKSLQAYRG